MPSSPAILRDGRIDPVTAYADQVLDGKIVAGQLVKAACLRHLDDLKLGRERGLTWRPDVAQYHLDFSRYCRHSKGEFAGKILELQPWQQFRIGSVFGWLNREGLRRFRTAYTEVAKKNGKSTEAAYVGLDALLADGEPGAEVYCGATKKDQARIVFNESRLMALRSPDLRARLTIRKNNLSVDATASKFEPLSADVDSLDGPNPHCTIVDEFHRHKSRDFLDLFQNATGARRQAFMWIITTSGTDDPETPYAQEREYAEKIVTRVLEDDSYFVYIATIDKGDAWDDPEVFIKANPNLGVSVKLSDLKQQANKARGSPPAQVAFKRLRLNVRAGDAAKAIPLQDWKFCNHGPQKVEDFYGQKRKAYLALDLSSKLDITAALLALAPYEQDELWRLFPRFWCPSDNVDEREQKDRAPYGRWINEGYLIPTPGSIIDYSLIEEQCIEWATAFELDAVPYDPWNATQTAIRLQEKGLPVVEFVQGLKSYTQPTKEFLALVKSRKISHGGDPVLTWMASNLKVETDKNENMMPTKKKSTGRIDGMTAAIMATGISLSNPLESKRTVYETRGIRTL